jgi:ribosomal protein S5
MVSVLGADSGPGVCEAVLGDSILSVAEIAGVDDDDWARDTGEKTKIRVAASTRDFIRLESLDTSSQN